METVCEFCGKLLVKHCRKIEHARKCANGTINDERQLSLNDLFPDLEDSREDAR